MIWENDCDDIKEKSKDRVTFSLLDTTSSEIVEKIRRQVYPENILKDAPSVRELLNSEEEERTVHANFSFFAHIGDEIAGYAILTTESRYLDNEMTVHLSDWAVLPEYRPSMVFLDMLSKIVDLSKQMNLAIQMQARDATSYRLFSGPGMIRWLERKGYKLSKSIPVEYYFDNDNAHFMRFEPIR